jgi:hypothetical protein
MHCATAHHFPVLWCEWRYREGGRVCQTGGGTFLPLESAAILRLNAELTL